MKELLIVSLAFLVLLTGCVTASELLTQADEAAAHTEEVATTLRDSLDYARASRGVVEPLVASACLNSVDSAACARLLDSLERADSALRAAEAAVDRYERTKEAYEEALHAVKAAVDAVVRLRNLVALQDMR